MSTPRSLPSVIAEVTLPSLRVDTGRLAAYRASGEEELAWATRLEVRGPDDLVSVIDRLRQIRHRTQEAEQRRLEWVAPGNAWLGSVNAAVKWVLAPLREADEIVNRKIADYRGAERRRAEEQARQALEEAQRQRERVRLAAELAARQAADAAEAVRIAAEAARQTEQARRDADDAATLPEFFARGEHADMIAEEAAKARATATAAVSEAQANAAEVSSLSQDANAAAARALQAAQVPELDKTLTTASGTRATLRTAWTFTVIDLANVPREYLCLDERKVREAIRACATRIGGRTDLMIEIPGLKIHQQDTMAFKRGSR